MQALCSDNGEFNFIIILSHIHSNIPKIYGKVRNRQKLRLVPQHGVHGLLFFTPY